MIKYFTKQNNNMQYYQNTFIQNRITICNIIKIHSIIIQSTNISFLHLQILK